jgi:hypothetical protein
MMFQIASMESLSKDNGFDVAYMSVNKHLSDMAGFVRTDTYNPMEYLNMFNGFKWKSVDNTDLNNIIHIPFGYHKFHIEDGKTYSGYLQSEKYFLHNRDYILKMFEPSKSVTNAIRSRYCDIGGRLCSIHVRRGDYLKYSDVHFVQDIDYFRRAVDVVKDEVDLYLIFSDDPVWCRNVLMADDCFSDKNSVWFVGNEKDYIELFLMSLCDHNIVSNSSFSWWGAWLNNNSDKIVVTPKRWWAGDDTDIIPESWIKV